MTKKDPFEGKQTHETKHNILNSQFDRYTSIQKFVDEKVENSVLKGVLINTLQFNEGQRPSFDQIVDILQTHQNLQEKLMFKQEN